MSAGGPSSVPVMTKTFASTLTAAILLVGGLLDDDGADTITNALDTAADAAEMAIAAAGSGVGALATDLGTAEHIFVVGSGGGYGCPRGRAEAQGDGLVHAEGSESWEMASGGATLIGPTSTVIALAPYGPGREAVLDVERHCLDWGARVVEIAPEPTIQGADHLPIAATANEDLASLDTLPPLALLAEALARTRGSTPTSPAGPSATEARA